MRKKNESLSDLAEVLSNQLTRVALRPDVNSYRPHPKQEIFHKSLARKKLYIGGNRSGKTVGGIVEDIWWLTGTHPYRETPRPPVMGRLVCVDFPNGWEKIVKPVLMQWIPPSALINGSWLDSWNGRTRTLTLANGSFLEIMSYDQEVEAFAGASRDFTHFDEEPPKEVFTECRARLIDRAGSYWITMTPVEGWSWVADDIYEPAIAGTLDNSLVIEIDMTENPYLSPNEIEDFLAGLDENEVKARKQGKFVQMGGLVFKDFDPDLHVLPAFTKIPNLGVNKIYGSMDHGLNHLTAFLWHIVTPNNIVITFAEHAKADMTIAQHAKRVLEIENEQIGQHLTHYWADPSTKQRNAVNGNSIQLEYRLNGVNLVLSNNDVRVGINRMLNYQRSGRWFITRNCPQLLREMKRYKWKTRESKKLQAKHGPYDEPQKKDDDCSDSARYFFMSRPELAQPNQVIDNREERDLIFRMLNAHSGANIFLGQRDKNLYARHNPMKELRISTDEMMGGEW